MALASPAIASGLDVTSMPTAQRNVMIAARYWGASVPDYRVEVDPVSSTEIGALAEAEEPGNWQRISPTFWNSGEARHICVVSVHEYGHSLGNGHSADPANVMYWQPSEDSVPGCNAAYPSLHEEAQKSVEGETQHLQAEAQEQVEAEARSIVSAHHHKVRQNHKVKSHNRKKTSHR